MNKPSDEQLREIGLKASRAGQDSTDVQSWHLLAGRAAFEASCRIALQEPSEEEKRQAERDWDDADLPFSSGWDNYHYCMEMLLERRLRSLTAQPDPAVEAVRQLMSGTYLEYKHNAEFISKIVAAVDAARAKK